MPPRPATTASTNAPNMSPKVRAKRPATAVAANGVKKPARSTPTAATKTAPKATTKTAPNTATKTAQKTATKAAPKTATKTAQKTATKSAPKTAPKGSSPKRRTRTISRRNEIIRAAAETFYRKGYDATTTQDIAEAVGMLKGSLYYYISAKEDLLYEIIDDVHEVLAGNLDVVAAMDGDPLTRIWMLVHHNVIVNAENLINSAVFFRDFGSLPTRRRKHIIALRDKGDTMLRELITDGQKAGLVRANVDAKLVATAINTMCNALYHWYKPAGELTPEEVARSYADLAVAGITADASLVVGARDQALAI